MNKTKKDKKEQKKNKKKTIKETGPGGELAVSDGVLDARGGGVEQRVRRRSRIAFDIRGQRTSGDERRRSL